MFATALRVHFAYYKGTWKLLFLPFNNLHNDTVEVIKFT
jgi:hypothetical protein